MMQHFKKMTMASVFLAVAAALLINPEVFATGTESDAVSMVICNIIGYVQSGVGKAIAILIMISMAIMLFLGKLSWGLAIGVTVGMGLLFGSATIVNTIANGTSASGGDNCTTKSTPAPTPKKT